MNRFLDSLLSVLEGINRAVFKSSDWLIHEKVTVVIPALNEAKTIKRVVLSSLASRFVNEVIVVDDGSTDGTAAQVAGIERVRVVTHSKNFGKGRAIKSGIENASNDVLLFLDADLSNFPTEKINALAMPVLHKQADLVKASFSRKRGRLTVLAARPMMNLLFPGTQIAQPLSGQFCCRKSFLSALRIETKWGIDVAILLDAIRHGKRVAEVDVGELVHKERSMEELAKTSEQVLETMLKKSGLTADRFKNVVFSESVLLENDEPKKNVPEVLEKLRQRRFNTVLLGGGGSSRLESLANRLLLDDYIAVDSCLDNESLLSWFKKWLKKKGWKLEETAVVSARASEAILFRVSGLGIGMGSDRVVRKNENRHASSLSDILLIE